MTLIAFDSAPTGKIAIHDYAITQLNSMDSGYCIIAYRPYVNSRHPVESDQEETVIVRHSLEEVLSAVNKALGV